MKKSLLTMIGACSLLFATASTPSPAHAAATCQDLLANNRYRCTFNSEIGGLFEDCFQFVSPGVEGTKFDLVFSEGESEETLACECKATGSLAKPKFNASTSFLCGNEEFGDAIEGKVGAKGQKIAKGQFFFNDDPDESLVFECVLDPTCTAPALKTSGAGFPQRR